MPLFNRTVNSILSAGRGSGIAHHLLGQRHVNKPYTTSPIVRNTHPVLTDVDTYFGPLNPHLDRGKNLMFTALMRPTDKKNGNDNSGGYDPLYYLKRITYSPYHLTHGLPVDDKPGACKLLRHPSTFGLPNDASLDQRYKTELEFSLWKAQREVFATRLAKVLLEASVGRGYTRDETFTGIKTEPVPPEFADKIKRDSLEFYYVVAREFAGNFEHLATFGDHHKVQSMFCVNQKGNLMFNHPKKGEIWLKGRITIKILTWALGLGDENIRNLALLGLTEEGRTKLGIYDLESCELAPLMCLNTKKPSTPREIASQLVGTCIRSNLATLNLEHLDITGLDVDKRRTIGAIDRVFRSPEGKRVIHELIEETFSPQFFEPSPKLGGVSAVKALVEERLKITARIFAEAAQIYKGTQFLVR